MKKKIRENSARRKRRIERRLKTKSWRTQGRPMLKGGSIRYEVAERSQGISVGGIGAFQLLVRRTGLAKEIDKRVRVLQRHLPYHESDHVLTIAYNALCGGQALGDLELLRKDECFLDALGADRIPDPTTSGDFCRRFAPEDVEGLMAAANECRLKVWRQQPGAFFDEAIIEADGTLVSSSGKCKEGMDFSYDGSFGYHPLIVSLANTKEPLFLINRGGNRPSHEGAAERFDQALDLVVRAGFRKVTFRGDTDFSQTRYLDGWDEQGVEFVFGIDAMPNLVEKAESLQEWAWQLLRRHPRYEVQTKPRQKPENIKERVVREREFRNLHLLKEDVAEFNYSPSACRKSYRVVVVRKCVSVEKGERLLFPEHRYLFYISNKKASADQIVFLANDRCDQENLIAQLKSIRALRTPVNNLVSNWAYMVMSSLAWSMKSWFALLLPITGRWRAKHESEKDNVMRMEFRTFLNAFVRVPALVIRSGRRIVYRLLSWNPWQGTLLRALDALQAKALC